MNSVKPGEQTNPQCDGLYPLGYTQPNGAHCDQLIHTSRTVFARSAGRDVRRTTDRRQSWIEDQGRARPGAGPRWRVLARREGKQRMEGKSTRLNSSHANI